MLVKKVKSRFDNFPKSFNPRVKESKHHNHEYRYYGNVTASDWQAEA